MAVIYKTLFDVKLLHEYYLTNRDGTTIFESVDQDARKTFLEEQYARGAESVSNDLAFEFPDSLSAFYESFYLKVLPSYSGFRVLTRVNKKILPDGTLVYEPLVSLPPDLAIHILLTKQSAAINHFTSARINRPLPALYFFSNQNSSREKIFPFLTNGVPDRTSNYDYEQGELAAIGDGVIHAYYPNAGGEQWYPLPGTGFASEADRNLLPSRFHYSFPLRSDIKEVTFTLKDAGGNTIKTVTTSSNERIAKFPLDFTAEVNPGLSGNMAITRKSFFTLSVDANGYMRSHPVFLSDIFYNQSAWGVVTLVVQPENAAFNLLARDGYLHKRDTTTAKLQPPLFEIPVRSRFAYWRYSNDKKREIVYNPVFDGFLERIDQRWITVQPKAISKAGHKLKNVNGDARRYFPNPTSYTVDSDKQGRQFFDITVAKSALFDI
ncbi:MAG: hypothetical protein ABIT05_14880 [Chitinophagaceae bacterium]